MSIHTFQRTAFDDVLMTEKQILDNITKNTPDYQVNCLASLKEIQTIKDDWEALEKNSAEAFQYFQTYQWCYNWCETFSNADDNQRPEKIMVYTLTVNGKIAIICPLMARRQGSGLRILTMLTDPLGQYANIIVNHSLVDEGLGRRFWEYVRKTPNIDAIQLLRFPKGSFLDTIIGNDGYEEKALQEALYRDFTKSNSWEEVRASLSRNARKQRNNRRKKLENAGKLEYEYAIGGTARYKELVALALDMKKIWLEESGLNSTALYNNYAPAFLSNLSGTDRQGGNPPQGANAHVLTVDGEPVGIEIGMILGKHYYSYLGAFSWEWKNLSPGKIQMEMTQKWAMENKIEKFDLMGDPAAYKSSWTDTTQPLRSVIVPASITGFFYAALWRARLRPALKTAANMIGPNGRKKLRKLLGISIDKSNRQGK